ncbi:hypothetical protein OIU83_12830 [Flavobacterium sp. LS1R49]|uniref:VWFA domain-containing protein n=1 Tax=Flavobacterium shii TaxID=2987687 RepID=A0A9X2ZFP6_9FLAO|nr:hypothetical protein [Flavobacterium shii]MCV9928545.1 hypothetical protein [Flavobacterium shii]
MKIHAYSMRKIALAVIVFLISISSVFAQADNSKIKDGTVTNGAERAKSGAILELESNSKGMLISRLTTPQRDAIIPANLSNGLLIFNITTGCFDYWNQVQAMWLSMCGSQPPATATISTGDCSKAIVNGTYKQGTALTGSNYLSVAVTVTQPGTYTISANTANGYYFSTNGAFPAAGSYVLTLAGVGTPNKGYDTGNAGDAVTITLNGTVVSCKPNVFVAKADVNFVLTCNTVASAGSYNIGLPLTNANKLTLSLNVGTVGYWSINTNTVNGYSFTGSGTFTTTGVQTVELLGTGTPLASGANSFTISSNAATVGTCNNIVINVAPVAYALNCSTATQSGVYMVDTQLIAANKIVLPINVTATGKATISTNTVNGMTFTTGEINLSALGQQSVTLLGTGKPTTAGVSAFTVSGTTGATASCALNVTVGAQPISYAINCGSITTSGSYMPGTAMTAANTMTVPVTVTYPGAYTMSTNTQNGITFSASGTFSTAGTQSVVMTATGTPTNASTYTFSITSNSTSAACTKSVDFGSRAMNVLLLNFGGFYNGDVGIKTMLNSKINYSLSGTCAVNDVKVFTTTIGSDDASATSLKNTINTNKIDVILYQDGAAANTLSNNNVLNVVKDFINNKKGVVIYGVGAGGEMGDQIAKLANAVNSMTGASMGAKAYNYPEGNNLKPVPLYKFSIAADATLSGPFGNVKNRFFGGFNNVNSPLFNNVPLNITILATLDGDNSSVEVFKHNELGFVYVGSMYNLFGVPGDTSYEAFPLSVSATGIPLGKEDYAGGARSTTVYNSVLAANTFAWAFSYATANTNINYQIK